MKRQEQCFLSEYSDVIADVILSCAIFGNAQVRHVSRAFKYIVTELKQEEADSPRNKAGAHTSWVEADWRGVQKHSAAILVMAARRWHLHGD